MVLVGSVANRQANVVEFHTVWRVVIGHTDHAEFLLILHFYF